MEMKTTDEALRVARHALDMIRGVGSARVAKIAVEALEATYQIEQCVRCGGAHQLSKCPWPLEVK